MTKAELIAAMAKEADISKAAAAKAVDFFAHSVFQDTDKPDRAGKIEWKGGKFIDEVGREVHFALHGDENKFEGDGLIAREADVDVVANKQVDQAELIEFIKKLAAKLDVLHGTLTEILNEGQRYRIEKEKYWEEIERLKEKAAEYGF